MMRWGRGVLSATLAAALLLAAPLSGIGRSAGAEESPGRLGEFIPAETALPAPEIAFTDLAGKALGLSDFKGKLVLINLWATWCQPCVEEMPSLEKLQQRQATVLTVLAVSQDRGGAKAVEPFLAKIGLKSVQAYLDPKSTVGRAFGVRGLPTSILIDGAGKVLGRIEGGADWDGARMAAALKPFLQRAAPPSAGPPSAGPPSAGPPNDGPSSDPVVKISGRAP